MKRRRDGLHDGFAVTLLCLLVIAGTWQITLAGRVLAGGDVFTYFYPYWAEATRAIRSARLPVWNPYLFMGVPFTANSQVGFFYPLNWPLWLLLPAHRSVHLTMALHLCLAAIGAYIWGRKALKLGRIASWSTGAVFALGGYLTAQIEHVNQLQGLAWLPLLLTVAHKIGSLSSAANGARDSAGQLPGHSWLSRYLKPCAMLAAVTALILLAGHTQTAFISLLGAAAYATAPALRQCLRRGNGKSIVRVGVSLLGGALLAIALSAIQLLPTWQLSRLSVRAQGLPFNERVSFSLSPLYVGRALLPLFGRTVAADHLEHVAYIGTSGLALAIAGVLVDLRRRSGERERRWTDYVSVYVIVFMGFLFALGLYNPLYVLLARYVPGFAHFRVPARWLALYAIGASAMIGRAVEAMWDRRSPAGPTVLIVGGFLVVLILSAVGAAHLSGERDLGQLTVIGWLGGTLGSAVLLLVARWRPRGAAVGLVALLIGELFLARRALPHGRATAGQAYTSLRPSVAHLLALQGLDTGPGDRFLSMSDTTFDPGDLSLIRMIYGPELSEDQLYEYVIATKQKEILSPNLPLAFEVPAVDGYDGGVLPLAHYVTLERAFLSAEEVSLDGRLREKLREIPRGRWLNLLNVRYVITDKLGDAWVDDVFYDLQFGAHLGQGDTAVVSRVPSFEATALGIVSYVEGAEGVTDGVPAGVVRIGFGDGRERTFELRLGEDVPHGAGDSQGGSAVATRLGWSRPRSPVTVTVRGAVPAGEWVVRGLSLIDERTGGFQSLVLSDEGQFRLVHSGDVKIYENLDVMSRAFIVGRARVAQDDEAALRAMQEPTFYPTSEVVLVDDQSSCTAFARTVVAGEEGTEQDVIQRRSVRITAYEPGRVVVEVAMDDPAYLLLTDAHYPGWEATVDGERVPICRADLLFRAVALEPGHHRVIFTFRPMLQWIGTAVTLVGLVSLLIIWRAHRIVQSKAGCYNQTED